MVTRKRLNVALYVYCFSSSDMPIFLFFSEVYNFFGIFSIGILVFDHNNFNSVKLETYLKQILKICENVMKT
jgi:hypothetical protein